MDWNVRPRRLLQAKVVLPLGLTVLATLGVFATVGLASPEKVTAPPKNQTPPTIAGTPQVGSTLTADTGNWSGQTSFAYQWRRCDQNGGSCSDIGNATDKTYTLKGVDQGNTLRVVVTAKNSDGSTDATSVPTAVIAGAAAPTPQPAANGCPKATQGQSSVAVADVAAPARLQIDAFNATPNVISLGAQSFTLRVHVSDTCGQPVSGANVYATAVPFNQVNIPAETQTSSDGWVALTFNKMAGFPASSHQQLMAFFIRASKPGENILAGVSTRRLISVKVNLHA